MTFRFSPRNQKETEEIVKWRYPGPYSFFDADADEEDLEEFLDPEQREGSYCVYDDGKLIGFFSFRKSGDTVDVALGMRPDLTGKGMGLSFFQAGLDFAREKYKPLNFTLSVAIFNKRAITVYERAGFKPHHTFIQATNGGNYEFLKMKAEL